jgi:DNA-binding NtrC family response regulator
LTGCAGLHIPAVNKNRISLSATEAKTILVVEDEQKIRELLALILQENNYNVLLAMDAVEADRIWNAHPEIQLVITDIRLPGASGIDLVALLRFRKPDLKALFMSGYNTTSSDVEGDRMAGIPFITKPFAPTELLFHVHKLLEA